MEKVKCSMQVSSEHTDVVIIGAGPAGLLAAHELGKQSVATIILEEHPKIGIPTSCAGLISVSGFKRLGIRLPNSVIMNRVRGAIFYSPSGKQLKVARKTPQAYVVDRAKFDQYLAQQTKKVGVPICLETHVKRIRFLKTPQPHKVEILTTQSESLSPRKILTKICIDAEGCKSRILRQTGISPPPNSEILPAIQYEYEGIHDLDPTLVEIYTGRKVAPGFFAWMIPTGNDTARIGLACKSFYSPRRHLEHVLRTFPLRTRLRGATRSGRLGGRILISGPIKKTYSPNFLVIGDAAGQIKPTTGGGVVVGGLCAQIAGKSAAKANQLGRQSTKILRDYQRRWKTLLGKEFLAMKWVRYFFNSLDDHDIDRLFKKIASPSIIAAIEETGDMDMQARAISLGLTRIPLLEVFTLLPKAAISMFRSL